MSSPRTFLCPSTGWEIHSGIQADEDTFSSLSLEVQVTCPACGVVHTWFTPSAFAREYRWKAAYWAAQAAMVKWPHTRELWRTMQQSYLRLADTEDHLEIPLSEHADERGPPRSPSLFGTANNSDPSSPNHPVTHS